MLDDCAKNGRGGTGAGFSDLSDLGLDLDMDVELEPWLEVEEALGLMVRKWKSCRVDRLALHRVFPSG
jgi:hypothetical protein